MNDKESRFLKRTLEHIHRVQKNAFYLMLNHSDELGIDEYDRQKLSYQVMKHDRSKFSKAQYSPYIELNEYYYQRRNLGNKDYSYPNESIKSRVDAAVHNHYHCENHHPEKYRCLAMFTRIELIEIMCDLQAMAQEFNEGSCRKYFTEVWLDRHDDKTSPVGITYMFSILECFENAND